MAAKATFSKIYIYFFEAADYIFDDWISGLKIFIMPNLVLFDMQKDQG